MSWTPPHKNRAWGVLSLPSVLTYPVLTLILLPILSCPLPSSSHPHAFAVSDGGGMKDCGEAKGGKKRENCEERGGGGRRRRTGRGGGETHHLGLHVLGGLGSNVVRDGHLVAGQGPSVSDIRTTKAHKRERKPFQTTRKRASP
eukprot:3766731-Rhodomonas_salina.4